MSAIKRATDALCEILGDLGFSCNETSPCWKKAECPEAQKLAKVIAPEPKP